MGATAPLPSAKDQGNLSVAIVLARARGGERAGPVRHTGPTSQPAGQKTGPMGRKEGPGRVFVANMESQI